MSRSRGRSRTVRLSWQRLAAAAGLLILAFVVGQISLANTLATRRAAFAFRLAPWNGVIRARHALDQLEKGAQGSAKKLAVEALASDPTALDAIAVLGLSKFAAGDVPGSGRFLAQSQRLSRRHLQTHLWAIEYEVGRNNIPRVLRSYDLALRTSAIAPGLLIPILARTIDDAEIGPPLLRMLRGGPPWRKDFLSFVTTSSSVPSRSALLFLSAARKQGLRPSAQDMTVLVRRSIDDKQLDVAWGAYLLTHPGASRAQVREPEFKNVPQQPTAFDWTLSNNGGLSAGIISPQGAPPQLEIRVGAGVSGVAAQQLQLLPAGSYALEAVVPDLALAGGGFSLEVRCLNGNLIASLPVTTANRARLATTRFQVGAQCPAQWLNLNASASDAAEEIRVSFSRVAIRRN